MSQTAKIELPPKLITVFSGDADVRGSYGGRGSGKTRSFAKMSAVRAYKFAQEGKSGVILCGRQYMNSLDDSSLEEVKQAILSEPWLAEYFEIGEKYVRTKCGRVRYVFSGLDRSISSIKSKARILICWVDEAEDVKEEAWEVLEPTIREEGSELWITWNPGSKHSATHRRYREVQDPKFKMVELNWRDNPRFPEKLNRQRLRDKENTPDSYEWIWEGAFRSSVKGAIYADQLKKARADGRICKIPIESGVPVHTFWDLGRNDTSFIWFMQKCGLTHRFIDCVENRLVDLEWYARVLKEKGYFYGEHFLPHDVAVTDLSARKSRKEILEGAGVKPINVVPRIRDVNEGIELTRQKFASCWFDEDRCEQGLEALANYQYIYDEQYKTFRQRPLHNWASNGADAFRQFAQGFVEADSFGWDKPIDYRNLSAIV